jgi:hypothetical protein
MLEARIQKNLRFNLLRNRSAEFQLCVNAGITFPELSNHFPHNFPRDIRQPKITAGVAER